MPEEPHQIILSSDNPLVAQIVNAVVKTRPLGWSRRSRASYYNEKNGKWLLRDIDAMIKDRKARIYRYSNFPGLSQISLYLKLNQSFRYILDNLDPDGLYKQFEESIRITRQANTGVIIRFESAGEADSLEAEVMDSIKSRPKWMDKMDEWLEGEETKPFIKEGLRLTDEEVTQIKLELSGITSVMAAVDNASVKIRRV